MPCLREYNTFNLSLKNSLREEVEAAITASLSQLLRWTELLLLWWESCRAQTKPLILRSGQRAVSESYSLTNTLCKVRSCIPKRATSFMPQHLLRSQKCSCAVGQRTLTSLHCQSCTCGTAQGHTGTTITPPCLLLPLLQALNTSKSDKKGKEWAQNRTGGIKADGPDKGPFG